jgi:hypothetical protein
MRRGAESCNIPLKAKKPPPVIVVASTFYTYSSGSCRRERRERSQAVGSPDSDLTERFGYARNHRNRLMAMVLAMLFYQSGL